MRREDIGNLTSEELKEAIVKIGQPPYRARQIFFWLYQKAACDFSDMANLPKALRDGLAQKYYIGSLDPPELLKSSDGTQKCLFGLRDKNYIESVFIPAGRRNTLCLSSQVGCKYACPFCASGLKGFVRNLTPSEITGQALYFLHTLKHKITNYVFMGMGEPLDNYDNVVKAITIMNDPAGMNIGARRVTISTCGVVLGIERLKDFKPQVNLSVSLHAANNKLRDMLMPINKLYPLEKLIRTCRDYIDKKGRTITFEYVLLKGINTSAKDADELAKIAKDLKAKINLIPYSPIPHLKFQAPSRREADIFIKRLLDKGVNARLRESKGEDIQAACGQLAGKMD